MLATLTARPTKFTTSHHKEKAGFYQEFTALVPPRESERPFREMRAVVTLRIYWPGDTTVYACLWTSPADRSGPYPQGSGTAGGGGYHKPSAAAGEAIRNARFDLSEDIDGRGDSSIREAVLAIAAAIGYPEAMLHVAHA